MAIGFGTSGARGLSLYEMSFDFKFIGELINEDKIIPCGEESAGMSVEGYYPEEDGISTRLLAEEAVAARGASLSDMNGLKFIFADNFLAPLVPVWH